MLILSSCSFLWVVGTFQFKGFERKSNGYFYWSNFGDFRRTQNGDFCRPLTFVLSDNYYESAASLNEMGAAWVLQKDYLCILLPGFEFKEIEGAVNPRKISIKLDAEQLTVCEYLNQWKAQLETNFHLTPIQQARWERIRTDFLEKTRKLSSSSTAV